jgi:holo-ACP synthase/triphosphoribosyl-dephospho-CoA synthase
LQKGLRGIRGEVADGLPSVVNIALPVLEEGLAGGVSFNDACACALIRLIAQVEDTNLYHRGGDEGTAFAKAAAKALGDFPTTAQIEALDDAFIARNLSPGGCADLLAATCFLYHLKNLC